MNIMSDTFLNGIDIMGLEYHFLVIKKAPQNIFILVPGI